MSEPNESNGYELSVTRYIDAPPEKVWDVMTNRTEEWWCPKPWRAEVVEQQWRPGGRSCIRMHGPDGEEVLGEGVFLEVSPGKRFVFTDAVDHQWLPQNPFMIGVMEIAREGSGTRFTGSARHWSEEAFKQHKAMGFEEGWAAMAAQLAELAEGR